VTPPYITLVVFPGGEGASPLPFLSWIEILRWYFPGRAEHNRGSCGLFFSARLERFPVFFFSKQTRSKQEALRPFLLPCGRLRRHHRVRLFLSLTISTASCLFFSCWCGAAAAFFLLTSGPRYRESLSCLSLLLWRGVPSPFLAQNRRLRRHHFFFDLEPDQADDMDVLLLLSPFPSFPLNPRNHSPWPSLDPPERSFFGETLKR